MINKLKAFMATEVFKYLFFGVLATVVYIVSRTLIFAVIPQGTLSAVLQVPLPSFLLFSQMMFSCSVKQKLVWLHVSLNLWELVS